MSLASRKAYQGDMSLINYDRLLATLLSQEQDLANELLTLSQEEHNCCESGDTDRLLEIVAQRKEVMSTWETHHQETMAVGYCFNLSGSPAKVELQSAIRRLNETIAAIQTQDQSSLQKLTQQTNQDISRLQSMNQGSRWLRYMNQPALSFAHDSRQ